MPKKSLSAQVKQPEMEEAGGDVSGLFEADGVVAQTPTTYYRQGSVEVTLPSGTKVSVLSVCVSVCARLCVCVCTAHTRAHVCTCARVSARACSRVECVCGVFLCTCAVCMWCVISVYVVCFYVSHGSLSRSLSRSLLSLSLSLSQVPKSPNAHTT